MTSPALQARLDFAKTLAREAGKMALGYFRSLSDLTIESKGAQDFVSEADRNVETFVRERLAAVFVDDGIVGEEHDNVASTSGYTWVIDPIDGTTNFVTAIPSWCVAIAVVYEDRTQIGVIYEPSNDELFWGARGAGAFLDETPMKVARTSGLNVGSTGVGMNGRTETRLALGFIDSLISKGGIFFRNGSGALMLSYVAAGRLIGYVEAHMNAWDCLAGQLLIAEAGGRVEDQSADAMLEKGGRVVAGSPDVFDDLVEMADAAFNR